MGLFLEINSAFPSVNHNMLIHDMQKQSIPQEYMDWIRVKLSGRTTRLSFNNYMSNSRPLPTGINQSCPHSLLSYMFYNSNLVTKIPSRNTLRLAFHNDMVLLADIWKSSTCTFRLAHCSKGSVAVGSLSQVCV